MTEGWFNDNYWALCDDAKEAAQVTLCMVSPITFRIT